MRHHIRSTEAFAEVDYCVGCRRQPIGAAYCQTPGCEYESKACPLCDGDDPSCEVCDGDGCVPVEDA